jgi:hypothetical protein
MIAAILATRGPVFGHVAKSLFPDPAVMRAHRFSLPRGTAHAQSRFAVVSLIFSARGMSGFPSTSRDRPLARHPEPLRRSSSRCAW